MDQNEKLDLILIELKRVRKELKEVSDVLELHRAEHTIGGEGGSTSGSGQQPGGMMGGPGMGGASPMGGRGQQPFPGGGGGQPFPGGGGGFPGGGGTPDFAGPGM